ncbi:PfkB family carbohydrate kinase [uncultured Paludibaculum sp.]|uniref:bifunctional heptose 7-phosphate kinase/heptose 1-phosphate adenyltransferase n=1 Tax=uncultured Paludibaculum sp. TaxID=1765020 RepID=UPI002AAB2C27|nr:PfkB family carbohydrate kinase [uncultured Paludibaculum sp.]
MSPVDILKALPSLSVLVVGDVCLDRWCRYDPTLAEPSRETGIPRIAVISREMTPGAAGTVASNLKALGVGRVAILGVRGDDGNGYELMQALASRDIDSSAILMAPELPTFTYTKLINDTDSVEDRPRVDFVFTGDIPTAVESAVVERLLALAPSFDVIIVSDQAETESGGLVTARVREALTSIAAAQPSKIIWVDSRRRGAFYRNVLVKLNEQEAEESCLAFFGELDYQALRQRIGHSTLIVTKGPKGAVIVEEGSTRTVETRPVEHPVDICGAGDSFNAGASVALALTGDAAPAVEFGNLVASITIMKPGTGTASPDEVLAAAAALRK